MRGLTNASSDSLLQVFSGLEEKHQKELVSLFKESPFINGGKVSNEHFEAFLIDLLRNEFKWFVIFFVGQIEGQNFDFALHCQILCEVCQQHSKNNLKYDNDVVINIPPGHSKTTICNILYSAWLMGKDPKHRMLVRTTSDVMAKETNNKTAMIMAGSAYQQVFGAVLTKFMNSLIETQVGSIKGYRDCQPMGSRITGRSASVILLDDPNNISTTGIADNAEFQRVISSYKGGIATRQRGTDNSLQTLIIQQRISNFDLSGDIIDTAERTGKPINHIVLRAEELEDKKIVIQCKDYDRVFIRPKGFLWYPNTPKMLENRMKLYETMKATPYLWASQYQQDPSDTGLSLIPIEWFQWYSCEVEELPVYATFITCDLAFCDNLTNDRTCICCWGLAKNGDVYLLDIIFKRIPAELIPDTLIEFYNRNSIRRFRRKETDTLGHFVYDNIFCFAFYIEELHNETLLPYLKNNIEGIKVLQRNRSSTKEIRLNKAIPILALKVMHLPRNRFFSEMVDVKEELRALTPETLGIAHDDMVDNIVDCINEGRASGTRAISYLQQLNYEV